MRDSNATLQHWTAGTFPPEVGKLAVVTCSTSSLGFEIALALAQAGADVILTGPRQADGLNALASIRPLAPNALVRFEKLDLESQVSVADFATRLIRAGRPIDLLINNASTLVLLKRQITRDRFELHLAANYLSHFALTARLLPLLRGGRNPRVVQVTSTGRHHGEIHFDDLHLENDYTPLKAYSQSKLAMMMFALELQRQSDIHGWGLISSPAQPVGVRAAQLANATEVTGSQGWYRRALGLAPEFSSGAGMLQTFVSAEKRSSAGTKSLAEILGPPVPEALDLRALDPVAARLLWETSTVMTKVSWPYI